MSKKQEPGSIETAPADAPAAAADVPFQLLEDAPAGAVQESELAKALEQNDLPTGGGITPAETAPAAAVPPADFKPWSATRRQRADRKEMRRRIEQLEGMIVSGQVASAPAGGELGTAAGQPAGVPLEVLETVARESLAKTLRVVSGIAKRMRGDHWELREEECAALGAAWAPVAAPYLGGFAAHLPLVGALAVTAEVFWPRIEQDMNAAKLAGTQALGVELSPVAPNAAE